MGPDSTTSLWTNCAPGGVTIRAIRDALDTRGGKCVGVFLWNQDPAQADHPRFPKGIPVFYYGGKTWKEEFRHIGTATPHEARELAAQIEAMLTTALPKLLPAPPMRPMGESLGRAFRAFQYVDEVAPVPETLYQWDKASLEIDMSVIAGPFEVIRNGNIQDGLPSGKRSPVALMKTATRVMEGQELNSKVLPRGR